MRVELAVARRAFKQVRLGAVVWALVFGATVASTALAYVGSFPEQASRDRIAATTGQDAGISILLGPVSRIDTVGGYTVYKCYVFLTTIGAIWGLLAATRLLRGEEDNGRWHLVLAGGTRAAQATIATLAALAAGVVVLFVGTLVFTLLAGRDSEVGFGVADSVVYAASIVVAPAVFVGVGAVTSQLARSRRLATVLGMAVFGITFVLRMVADSGPGTKWLLWLTPFGWIERIEPFTENDLRPLGLAAVAVVVLVAAATYLVSHRDAGAGVLAGRDVVPPRRLGLTSPLGLAARLELPVLAAWCAGAAAAAIALGIIGKVATGNIPDSLRDNLEKFGVEGDFVKQYFGVAFLFLATVVALLPASQVGAASEEETSGRLVHLLAQPSRRGTLLGGRLALAAAGIVVAALLAGPAAWVGARSQGVDLGLGTMVGAGLNVVPTALLVLGIGAVTLALLPAAATPAVYAVVIGSLIIDMLTSLVDGLSWLSHLSLFHYMALAPAQDPDPLAVGVTLALALALCLAATALFERRDVQTG